MAVINSDCNMLEIFDAIDYRYFMLIKLLRIQYAFILFDHELDVCVTVHHFSKAM